MERGLNGQGHFSGILGSVYIKLQSRVSVTTWLFGRKDTLEFLTLRSRLLIATVMKNDDFLFNASIGTFFIQERKELTS